jgi:hypothetical protein
MARTIPRVAVGLSRDILSIQLSAIEQYGTKKQARKVTSLRLKLFISWISAGCDCD